MESEEANPNALIAYFGYGSLANPRTHQNETVRVQSARLAGWRRQWRPRPDMPGYSAALLTVHRAEGACCDGLLVIDQASNLPDIDRREARYHRRQVTLDVFAEPVHLPVGCPVYVYEADTEIPVHRDPPKILRSYLDTVFQGFFSLYGEDGVRRFVAETQNWDIGIADDRNVPQYPRAIAPAETERVLFDSVIAGLRVREEPFDGSTPLF